jgi:hypothetical protein
LGTECECSRGVKGQYMSSMSYLHIHCVVLYISLLKYSCDICLHFRCESNTEVGFQSLNDIDVIIH